jgi:Mce-associated membrane protein
MLSYSAADVEKDFEHDRTLVTEGYRPELVKEQEAVRKAGPADNEYWVTNKAVLEASRNTGAMLMLLQGQRGAPPNQRFITASLRVTFEKVAGQWKIAGLTVLAPPKLPDPPKAQEPAKPAPSGKPAPKPAPAPPPTGPGR